MSDTSSPTSSQSSSSQYGWSYESKASSPDSSYSDPTSSPEKTPDSDATTTEFFFVDPMTTGKTSTQYSQAKQKQAFLAKRYHRERKQAAIQRLKSTKSASRPTTLVLLNARGAQFSRKGKEFIDEDQRPDDSDAVVRNNTGALTTYLGQGFQDPFNSYAIPMTNSMHMYLDHFRIHGVGAAYPLNVTLMGTHLWRDLISIPALVNIFCFFSARHIAMLEAKAHGASQSVQMTISSSFQFRGNVLKYLNDIMGDPTNAIAETTIYAVASFVTIEASMGNIEAVMAHQRGLKRLVHLIGGIEALPHMTLSKLYQCDVKSAILRNKQPIFPMSARFRSEICRQSDVFHPDCNLNIPPGLEGLGVRFSKGLWFTLLNRSMQASVTIFRRLILYFENAVLHPEQGLLTDNDILVVTEHQLLSLSFSADKAHSLNEPLRVCLLLYLNLRVWHLQGLPILDSLVASLQEYLEAELLYLKSIAPDLMFWMLFMGGMASRGGSFHPWFVAHLIETKEYLQVQDWDEARVILTEFFYTHQPGVTGAEDLWNEALLAKSYPYIAPKTTLHVVRK